MSDQQASVAIEERKDERAVVPALVEDRGDLDEIRALISLERDRIDSNNRRADVMRFAIEANDASDKRQFEFRMANLNTNAEDRLRRFGMASNVAYGLCISLAFVCTLLFFMTFFGNEHQSMIAVRFLIGIGTAVGGYGFIEGVKRIFNRLIDSG